MNRKSLLALSAASIVILTLFPSAYAIPSGMQFFPAAAEPNKFLAASLAFGLAAVAAGFAVGKAGSAGLAAAAERPELRTLAIIITALGEALAIYRIVIAILILGQA